MKVLVLYDSKYGNTRKVAEAISEGLNKKGQSSDCVSVAEVNIDDVKNYGAFVLGSPTHVGSATRKLKKVFKAFPDKGISKAQIAFFDTRMPKENNGAVKKLETMAQKMGYNVIAPGLIIEVTGMKGPLEGEGVPKSQKFGETLAGKLK
jgi:menaquinone-dependent protoporphyrinogen IX oxidase